MSTNSATNLKAPRKVSGLSTSGVVFFGSLCVGTFGLGVWQLQRLLEKQDLIEERTNQLKLEPTTSHDLSWLQPNRLDGTDSNQLSHYRRRALRGIFRYEHEVLVGPRGAPPGVTLPRQGLSAKSGKGGGGSGSAPGPQGYHVLTPMELVSNSKQVIWVNRGWIPKTMVPASYTAGRQKQQGAASSPTQTPITWDRPSGLVEIAAVQTAPERTYARLEFITVMQC